LSSKTEITIFANVRASIDQIRPVSVPITVLIANISPERGYVWKCFNVMRVSAYLEHALRARQA
jgi:Mrp family chromosome partitioning ATPase